MSCGGANLHVVGGGRESPGGLNVCNIGERGWIFSALQELLLRSRYLFRKVFRVAVKCSPRYFGRVL